MTSGSQAQQILQRALKLKSELADRRKEPKRKPKITFSFPWIRAPRSGNVAPIPAASEPKAVVQKPAQVKQSIEHCEAELDDIVFLLGFPELCPPELALTYSPVCSAVGAAEKTNASKSEGKPRKPSLFERTVQRLARRNEEVNSDKFRDAVLEAYGLQTMGEFFSALKREYAITDGGELAEVLRSELEPFDYIIDGLDFFVDLISTADLLKSREPQWNNPDPSVPWEPSTRFEQYLLNVDREYRFEDWHEVGKVMMRLYATEQEYAFATRVLEEYGCGWGKFDLAVARLDEFSYRLTNLAGSTRYVKAWLYYFCCRFWPLAGYPRQKDRFNDIPEHREFDGDYERDNPDGIYIFKEDWDHEYVRKNDEHWEREVRHREAEKRSLDKIFAKRKKLILDPSLTGGVKIKKPEPPKSKLERLTLEYRYTMSQLKSAQGGEDESALRRIQQHNQRVSERLSELAHLIKEENIYRGPA